MVIKDRVCQHLRSIGFTELESSRYASLVQKWCDHSGPEWTVERLKALRVAFKESLETGEYTLPANWATRRNRSGKTIVRDGFVHRVLTLPNEGKNLVRKEGFLRIYQVIKLGEPSAKQITKMMTAIMGDSTANPKVLENAVKHTKVRRVSTRVVEKIRSAGDHAKSLPQLWGSASKRSPAYVLSDEVPLRKTKLKSTSRSNVEVAKWIDYFAADRQTYEYWERYPEFVGNRMMGGGRTLPPMRLAERQVELPAGTLSVIEEGGAKARWVANPFLPFQALGEPLKVKLWEYTNIAYSDVVCTADQNRGYETVTEWLQQGRTVWCFDASSWTDRFPLSLQLSVLQQLQEMGIASEADVEGLKLVVKKPWTCGVIGQDVVWTVGQPLGYGPSFHLATLTHAALVDSLHRVHSEDKSVKLFRIVGDDIVIADKRLADAYERAMLGLGVDINRQKSLISNEYAEFLGKLISKSGVNPSIKVKLLTSSDQIVDTLRFYGPNGLKWLTPRERELAWRAYLPSDLGGFDWRIAGTKYGEWLAMTQQESFAIKRLVKDVTAFYGREALSSASDVELQIKRRMEFYSINSYDLGVSEWDTRGDFEGLNALTDLPIAKPREESRPVHSMKSTEVPSNTFVSIMDMVSKQAFGALESDTSSQAIDKLLRNTHVAITRHGYLNETEKPYTGQSVIEVHNEQQSPTPAVKERHVLKQKGRRRRDSEDSGPEGP